MANFNFTVDTTPMAQSVDSVSGHLAATTAAVVAMEAAVIASEKKAADKVCANVDKGFYNLVKSQISMKISACYTEMQAKLALLVEYAKTLSKMQERMEGDYSRVKGQYTHIFKSLDKALANRIAQLDKDPVSISDTRKKLIAGMFERNVSETIVTSAEVSSSNQQIAASRIKNKTNHSLDFLVNKVSENQAYKQLAESMLDSRVSEMKQEEYIPVIYASKQSSLVTDKYVFDLYYPEYLTEQIRNSIGLNVLNQEEMYINAHKDDFERKAVSDEFQSLVASSSLSQRVAEKMLQMFELGGC